jgi:hypothetical protein
MLPAKVDSIWPSSFRGEDVLTVANQKQELLLAAIFVGQTSIKLLHMVPLGQQIWPPRAILFSDWLMLKKSSPLKLLGRDASCQGWLHLAKQFQRRRCFNISQSETRPALGGHVYWPNGTK